MIDDLIIDLSIDERVIGSLFEHWSIDRIIGSSVMSGDRR
jgi:hypothetical protein